MALSIIETSSLLTLNGWLYPLTINKDNMNAVITGNGNLPIIDVPGRFRIKKNGFFRHEENLTGIFTSPTGYVSHSTQTGSDNFGNYLKLTLNYKVKVTDAGEEESASIRFTFYEDRKIFDALMLTNETALLTFAKTYLVLNFEAQMTQWFTLAENYTHAVVNSAIDWHTNFGIELYPVKRTGAMQGCFFYTGLTGGIGHYIDAATNVLLEKEWAVGMASSATPFVSYLYASAPKRLTGFAISADAGYPATLEYNEWLQRNYLPSKPLAEWGYRVIKISEEFYVEGGEYPNEPFVDILHSDVPATIANQLPVNVYQNDYGWQDKIGDWNIRPELKSETFNMIQDQIGKGLIPGCWAVPYININSQAALNGSSELFANNGQIYAIVTEDCYMVNPFSAEGKAHLENFATKIVQQGFRSMRWDFLYSDYDIMFAATKIVYEKLKSLDPEFYLEQHHGFLQLFSDSVRTNDVHQYYSDWDTRMVKQYKMALVHAPNKILDVDGLGTYGSSLTPGSAGEATITSDKVLRHMKMQFGYGRPTYTYLTPAWVAAVLPDILTTWRIWDTLPREIPKRTIGSNANKDNWEGHNVRLTYSDGSTVDYDKTTETLTFNILNPVNEDLYEYLKVQELLRLNIGGAIEQLPIYRARDFKDDKVSIHIHDITGCFPLIDINDEKASKVRVFLNNTIKAISKQ